MRSTRTEPLAYRLRRWFPRWTSTRWGTWTTASVYLLAAAGLAAASSLHEGRWLLLAVLAVPYLVVAARHVAGGLRWSERPVPRPAERDGTDGGLGILRDGT